MGSSLTATPLYCSLKNITQHLHPLPFLKRKPGMAEWINVKMELM